MRDYYSSIFCTAKDALGDPTLQDIVVKGYLVPSQDKKFCEIWFPYSIEIVKLIKPNKFLCVRNFSNFIYKDGKISTGFIDKFKEFFSILEIVDIDIIHYDILAMSKEPDKLRLEETFEKYKNSWRRSSRDTEDENLRIVVRAVSCNTELVYRDIASVREYKKGQIEFRHETEPPAYGEDVFLMKPKLVNIFINGNYGSEPNCFMAGYHKMYGEKLKIYINHKQLFNRHFGIFGFSGAGKSNLASTLIRRSLMKETDSNVVIFDSNSEYLGILLDSMLFLESSYLVLLDDPGGYIGKYLRGSLSIDEVVEAAKQLMDRIVLPDDFSSADKKNIFEALEYLFLQKKIKIYYNSLTVKEVLIDLLLPEILKDIKNNQPSFKTKEIETLQSIILNICQSHSYLLTMNYNMFVHIQVLQIIDDIKQQLKEKEYFKDVKQETKDRLANYMEKVKILLNKIAQENKLLEDYIFSINYHEITRELHDKKKSLFIIMGDSDNSLREVAFAIGYRAYYLRKNGLVSEMPSVLFFFEEADLFLPSQTSQEEKESIRLSKKIATTLARRGRKYKLGIGISTQRISYMDTSIIAQLSTYFVSKLPRKYDREKVAEAFGIESQMIDNTLSLDTGEWMVITHSGALYKKGVPTMVKFDNANMEALKNTVLKLEDFKKKKEQLFKNLIAQTIIQELMKDSEKEDLSPVVVEIDDHNKEENDFNNFDRQTEERQEFKDKYLNGNGIAEEKNEQSEKTDMNTVVNDKDKYFEFFSLIVEYYRQKQPLWRPVKPQKNQNWLDFGAGKTGLAYRWRIKEGNKVCVELYINKELEQENLEIYRNIFQHKNTIEMSLSEGVIWDEMPGRKACAIRICKDINRKFKELNENEYSELALWASNKMYEFEKTLSGFLKS